MVDHEPGAAPERWYGAQEAARLLGVHRSTLHVAVQQRLIVPDARTPGGHLRFKKETLDAFSARLAEGAATGEAGVFAPMRTLAELAHLLVVPTTFEQVCRTAIAGIRLALPGLDMCCLAIRGDDPHDRHALRLVAQYGFPQWVFADFMRLRSTFKFATTIALRTLAPEICEDTAAVQLHTGTARICRNLQVGAYAVFPIQRDDEALGVLVCASHKPRPFSEHDHAFLQGIVDELAAVLGASEHRERLTLNLDAARDLISAALMPRAASSDARGEARETTRKRLGEQFLRLSGAIEVCALGFASDLPTRNTHLLALTCEACAGSGVVTDQWSDGGAIHTGVATSVPIRSGLRAGVGAIWQGTRPSHEADHALLVTFAGAYLLALSAA